MLAFLKCPRRSSVRPALLSTLLLLGACSGEGGGPIELDPRGEPDDGIRTAAGLLFSVVEDGVLEGVLSDASRPGALVSTPFSLLSAPGNGALELGEDGRRFRYRPRPDFNGTDGFDYATDEGRTLSARIDVTPVPDAPVLDPPPPLIAERDVPFRIQLVARDADEETLRFEASGLPAWLELDPLGGVLAGTPTVDDLGRAEGIVFAVLDPSGRRDASAAVALEVIEPDESPLLDVSGFPRTLDGRERLVVTVLPPRVELDGVALSVESGEGLSARVEGRTIVLDADDVASVSEITLVVELVDRLGESRRALVPMSVLPRTASGLGRTLLGSRDGRGLHLVVQGDGYRRSEQDRLLDDARALIALMRRDPGTRRHLAAFNIHVLESVSLEGGIDDGPLEDTRETLLDSHYDCEGVPRLICTDLERLYDRALLEYPDVREIVLFINDERSGGSGASGGGVAIAARAEPDIALHEMGHSLAGLGDEYVDGALIGPLAPAFVEGRYPNLSAFAEPGEVPWARWIEADAPVPGSPDEPGVGVFEGGLYRERGVYRPTFTSRMREYAQPFGSVNAEQWVLGVYRAANIVRAFEPFEERLRIVTGETQRFSVTPYFPDDVQAIEWSLNGERIRQADDARVLEISPLPGTYRVGLTVRDVSGLIRLEPPHSGIYSWTWELEVR